jgi:hypothetical protein
MKTLTQLLNESLHGITVRQYKGIWQGKFDVNLDEDHLNNPIYFFTELLYAHKQTLPTTEEFANVCKFIVTKMKNADNQLLEEHFNLFTKRFIEIYFTDIIRGGALNSYGNMNLWDMSSNDAGSIYSNKFDVYTSAVFFGRLFLKRTDKNVDKQAWERVINELGEKYKLTTKNWPDYSVGIGIVRDAIKK